MIVLRHPLLPLLALLVAVIGLLSLPLRLPIGPNYWDLYTYVDTAYRISVGQLPHIDFFVPVGALGYWLYIQLQSLFPQAHTLLLVHYAILIVALPIMAWVVMEGCQRSRIEAMALALPFAFFALVPINGVELYPSPGFDGYGNYNRHVALLLYVLAAALLFVENRWKVALIAAGLLAALFMVKVTGFVVGFLLCIHALLTRRMGCLAFLAGLFAIGCGLGIIEWKNGLISAYVADIIELVSMNTGSLLPRILTVLSVKFNVVGVAAALVLLLLWQQRREVAADLAGSFKSMTTLGRLLDRDVAWLVSLLLAGTIFETQNTGSHEYILIWPAVVLLFRQIDLSRIGDEALKLGLIAAMVLPTPVSILHRTVRTIASAPGYVRLVAPQFEAFGRVSVKPDIMRQSRAMLAHYPMARGSYEQFANRGVLPSYILFSEIDFQVSWLVSVEQAANALRQYEQTNAKFFRRIVTLDFVDPLPVILKREPLKDLSIGNDPTRTLAKLGAHAVAEIASADAILVPLCPVTEARNAIAAAYAPSLAGRRLVALTPCFNMLVKE
jgi:hypothetical protein